VIFALPSYALLLSIPPQTLLSTIFELRSVMSAAGQLKALEGFQADKYCAGALSALSGFKEQKKTLKTL
jgi:hypothetical protein